MSDLITTAHESYRDACIGVFVTLVGLGSTLVERAKDPRGQTAAEYMGVILLVAIIILAITKAGVATKIKDALVGAVDQIAGASNCGDAC
jgi:hypothetical protein